MFVADVVAFCQSPGIDVHMSRYSLRPRVCDIAYYQKYLIDFSKLNIRLKAMFQSIR